jgi:hypothetical protein
MLFLIAAAAAAGILAYYFFRGGKTEEPKQTGPKGTANRDYALDRRAPSETGRPEIHRRKVESAVAETLRRAEDQAEDLLRRGGEEKLAWESYFLAESIQEMFSRNEFFEGRRRFDSFRMALKAAEDARDKLIGGRREEARQKEMASAEGPGYLKDMISETRPRRHVRPKRGREHACDRVVCGWACWEEQARVGPGGVRRFRLGGGGAGLEPVRPAAPQGTGALHGRHRVAGKHPETRE